MGPVMFRPAQLCGFGQVWSRKILPALCQVGLTEFTVCQAHPRIVLERILIVKKRFFEVAPKLRASLRLVTTAYDVARGPSLDAPAWGAIRRLADEPWQVNLAVSLHAADDELRSRLVPINRRYPLAEVEAAHAQLRVLVNNLQAAAELYQAVRLVEGGTGSAMAVSGPTGIGKTRIVEEAVDSSDVDLIFAYPEPGETSRGKTNQQFFVRVGQQLIQAIGRDRIGQVGMYSVGQVSVAHGYRVMLYVAYHNARACLLSKPLAPHLAATQFRSTFLKPSPALAVS